MKPIVIEYPGKLVSLNVMLHDHRMKQVRRAKAERQAAWAECLRATHNTVPELPIVVTVTRVAPKALDGHDNLTGGCKATVDGIADFLRVKDDDPRVTWRYGQQLSVFRRYGVRIEIEARSEVA